MLVFTGLGLLERFLPFLLLPFVTRAMSVADYGAVGVVTASSALCLALLGGSVEQAVFRWSAKEDAEGSSVLRAARAWLMVAAPAMCLAISAVFLISGTPFLQVDAKIWAVEFFALAFSLAVSSYALPRLRALRSLSRFAVVAVTSITVGFAGKIILVMILGLGAFGWVLSDVATGLLGYSMAAIVVPRLNPAHVTRAAVTRLARFSVPLIPHVASFWALYALSRPLLALYLPLADVAVYSVAMSAASLGTVVIAEVNRAVLPEYARSSFPIPRNRLRLAMRIQVVAPFIVSQLVVLATPAFVFLVLPPEYSGATSVLSVLSLMTVGYGIYLVFINIVVQTAGVTTWSWIASVAGAVFTFVGCAASANSGSLPLVAAANVLGLAIMAAVAALIVRIMRLAVDWRAAGLLLPSTLVALTFSIGAAIVGATELQGWVSSSIAALGALACVALGFRLLRGAADGQIGHGSGNK